METKTERVDRLLASTAEIARATLPVLANKPLNEKTLDDEGMEMLMSGFLFMYDGNTPDAEQFQQLKDIATAAATMCKDMRKHVDDESLDDEQQGLFNLCFAFLHMWRRNIDFKEGQPVQ